ncbi:Iron-sulfur cluster assembly 2-like, mitochondrial [Symbiodinium microadriaticum]|uniref:Iron-sulfur cluster assembly 2-like, mitochondrial n=1 Tax=Symbiodinium microadriaticum TaxID=2951 RepID=A0A1Q9DBM1_SYMMI|nr:Iron-sulfur cluster assembly 2-like, mitochondrial [Symbiodinium microadriaticum]
MECSSSQASVFKPGRAVSANKAPPLETKPEEAFPKGTPHLKYLQGKGSPATVAVCKGRKYFQVLRLTVNSGGCSGYSYDFRLEPGDMQPASDDIVISQNGARLIVDELSMTFLEECEIDYTEEMIRASFSVVKNKLADSKCGCGSSFSVASF